MYQSSESEEGEFVLSISMVDKDVHNCVERDDSNQINPEHQPDDTFTTTSHLS